MSGDHEFDVFLAHHSDDKPFVLEISTKLKQRGLKPWVDKEQIAPGRSFQEEIQQAIPTVKTAAIILGVKGVGRWQKWEIHAFFAECVERGATVIPVLLPGVDEVPDNLRFLRELMWINFSSPDDTTALELMIWGITDKRPQEELDENSPSTTSTKIIQPSSFDADIHFNQIKAQSYQRFKVDVLYKITSKATNKVLAISSGSTNRGANLIQWEWLNNDEQKFQIFRLEGEQEYSLRVRHSRQCLAVPDRSTDRGVALIQWECNSYAEQQFEIIPCGKYYAFKAKHSGMVMTVTRNDEKNNEKVCQYPQFSADFSDDQLFRIEEVGSAGAFE
jgi:TIR domain/Ricin-type beta-trefoil lectin domain-like